MTPDNREGCIRRMLVWGLILGFGGIVVSGFWWLLIGLQGVPVSSSPVLTAITVLLFVGMVGGFLMAGLGLVLGINVGQSAEKAQGPIRSIPGCQVMNRIALNQCKDTIFDLENHVGPYKLFVQIAFPDGRRQELVSTDRGYEESAEGMVGVAHIQGNVLVGFEATGRPQQQPDDGIYRSAFNRDRRL